MSQSYGFNQQMAMSQGVSESASVGDILLRHIPGAVSVVQANEKDDRSGVDWWVTMQSGDRLGVDCKIRGPDYFLKGKDDLALESWSVVEKQIIGWTRNAMKRTDYVLWLWKSSNRWCLVPFPMLCKVFTDNWEAWRKEHQVNRQHTTGNGGGYHSECIFVPRRLVWAEIYSQFSGSVIPPNREPKWRTVAS